MNPTHFQRTVPGEASHKGSPTGILKRTSFWGEEGSLCDLIRTLNQWGAINTFYLRREEQNPLPCGPCKEKIQSEKADETKDLIKTKSNQGKRPQGHNGLPERGVSCGGKQKRRQQFFVLQKMTQSTGGNTLDGAPNNYK